MQNKHAGRYALCVCVSVCVYTHMHVLLEEASSTGVGVIDSWELTVMSTGN